MPEKNDKDVAEISEEIKSGMDICFVGSMDDVIPLAFTREIKTTKTTRATAAKK